MKEINRWLKIEPETVALVLGLVIGLGLAVHEAFFAVALTVVLIVVGQWTVDKAHQFLRDLHLRRRHP